MRSPKQLFSPRPSDTAIQASRFSFLPRCDAANLPKMHDWRRLCGMLQTGWRQRSHPSVTTVSGVATISDCFHPDQNRRTATQKSLSTRPMLGLGCRRFTRRVAGAARDSRGGGSDAPARGETAYQGLATAIALFPFRNPITEATGYLGGSPDTCAHALAASASDVHKSCVNVHAVLHSV